MEYTVQKGLTLDGFATNISAVCYCGSGNPSHWIRRLSKDCYSSVIIYEGTAWSVQIESSLADWYAAGSRGATKAHDFFQPRGEAKP